MQTFGVKLEEYVGRFLLIRASLMKLPQSDERDRLINENMAIREALFALKGRADAGESIGVLAVESAPTVADALSHLRTAEGFIANSGGVPDSSPVPVWIVVTALIGALLWFSGRKK